jgi:tryptophan synthase alpha chain
MREIARNGSGFVYLISRRGVTGVSAEIPAELPACAAMLKRVTQLPVCIGFGVTDAAQARSVAAIADGVVVGSAIVRAADRDVAEAVALTRSMRLALDSAP